MSVFISFTVGLVQSRGFIDACAFVSKGRD